MAALVDVYLTHDGKTGLVKAVDEITLRKSSRVARHQLETGPKVGFKRVDFAGTSGGPLFWLIDQMRKHGASLRIKAGDRKLSESIALFQATEAVQIQPPQPQLYKQLKWYISHEKMTPEDIAAIDKAFGQDGNDHELWCMGVHHLAWDFTHDRFTETEWHVLVEECEKHPKLNAAVLAKMDEITNREAAKAQKKARVEQKKQVAESNRRVREFKETRHWEETHGLREASNNTVDWVMRRQAGYLINICTKETGGEKAGEEFAKGTEQEDREGAREEP